MMKSLALILFLGALLMTSACNAWFIRNGAPIRIFAFDSEGNGLGTLEAKSRYTIDFSSVPITISPCPNPNTCDDSNWLPFDITERGCYMLWDSRPNFYTSRLACADEEKIKNSCSL